MSCIICSEGRKTFSIKFSVLVCKKCYSNYHRGCGLDGKCNTCYVADNRRTLRGGSGGGY